MLKIEHFKEHLHQQNPKKRARGRCMGKHLVFTLKRGLSFCRRTFEGLTVQRSVEKGFNFISPFLKDCSPKPAPITSLEKI